MGHQDFISEIEAAYQAGVSIKTLQRFSEAGYLQVEVEPDGLRLYSQKELNDIFGVHRGGISQPQPDDADNSSPAQSCSVGSTPTSECSGSSSSPETTSSVASFSEPEGPETTSDTACVSQQPDATTTPVEAVSSESDGSEETLDHSLYAIEILKLRNVISLQEKLLDTKDAEILDLKGQRDWLRARVEKLEEKSDRDQILLLSETQTIRKLISIQEQRRSPVNRLLEWLGIAPQGTLGTKALGNHTEYASNNDRVGASNQAIEVKSVANQ
jgi:hypothetical protein